MYNILIVDDEKYAVDAILACVDWPNTGITGFYTAADVDAAKDVIRSNPVDIILCDIEMPDGNGLELQEWINGHYPETVTILITGHAEFAYARQAVRLGSFDYLLKPVKHKQLAEVVNRAIRKLQQDREERQYTEMYKKYERLWQDQQPLLWERFWQDILAERTFPTDEHIAQSIEAYGLPIHPGTFVRPILLSIEEFYKTFNQRDEEIMEYALCKAAEELLLDRHNGDVIRDRDGILLVLMYVEDEREPSESQLEAACRHYIEACSDFFYCRLSCYVGEALPIHRLTESYHALIEIERDNVAVTESVWFEGRQRSRMPISRLVPVSIDWSEWTVLFETGRKEELLGRFNNAFREMEEHPITPESLEAVYHLLLHMVYHVSHRRGWAAKEVIGGKLLNGDMAATRSLARLKLWGNCVIASGIDFFQQHEGNHYAMIEKVKQYIHDHLGDVSRETLAAHVYLNSAYLSRMFKKETGQSLMDYVITARMKQAKILLTETNLKISDIGDSLGYNNFSYFSKLFKKNVGVTPQEYRKRYQGLEV